jgi:hypothetical protein
MSSEAVAEIFGDIVEQACQPVIDRHFRLICCILMPIAVVTVVAVALAAAFAVVHPVATTVEAASLSRLAPANGTTTTTTYGLTLTVALRNPNVALRALHAAPLEADIRVAGRRFGSTTVFRLADAGQKLHAKERVEYHVEAAGTVALAAAPDVPPLGMMVPVEVALAGEVMYRPFHSGRHALAANCALQLQLPPPPGATQVVALFHPIKCVRA